MRPGRVYVLDCSLLKISKYTQERHFYMFSDVLIWTAAGEKQKQTVKV